ncbi:flagellar hook-basal body protein [bacterium]|jgi:flagellar basal-body rod protein FlgF|nr:flagellar hook-basal body protein [bacterium]
MLYGLYLSTAGAKAQSNRQDVVANNIANVDATGFRRQFVTARQRLDRKGEIGQAGPIAENDPRRIGGGVHLFRTYNDLDTQGVIKPSSSRAHMAIEGEGFFRIQKGNTNYLSRDGAFSFGPDGSLRTADGEGVLLSTDGAPFRVDANYPFEVSPDNQIIQNGRPVGTIALVQPTNLASVERQGDNLLGYDGRDQPAPGNVKQGFLEGSNVDPVHEMVDMIETARAFEINIQMIQLQSDGLSRLIDQLPRPV